MILYQTCDWSNNQSRKRGFDVWKLHCRDWCFYFETHNARKTFLMHPDMIPENWTIWKNFLFSHCSHFVDALLLKSSACQRYKYALVTCTSPHFPHRPLNTALMPCGIWAVFIFHSVFFCFKHIIGLVLNTFVLIFDVKIGPGFKNTPQCTLLKSCWLVLLAAFG